MKIASQPQRGKVEINTIGRGKCFWDEDELYLKVEDGVACFINDAGWKVNAVRLRDGFLKGYSNDYPVIPENEEEVVFNRE